MLTADDQIVVLHDLLVDRTTNGTGAVKDMTAAQVAALDAGSWFGAEFAGETRADACAMRWMPRASTDLVFEIEIKEKLRLDAYIDALKLALADPEDLGRVMMISFDHAHLKAVKAAIPGIRTGGIVHERYADPVAVARSADLDELCIDLSVFEAEDAVALHAAGISIRCHAYNPKAMEKAGQGGPGLERGSGWLSARPVSSTRSRATMSPGCGSMSTWRSKLQQISPGFRAEPLDQGRSSFIRRRARMRWSRQAWRSAMVSSGMR